MPPRCRGCDVDTALMPLFVPVKLSDRAKVMNKVLVLHACRKCRTNAMISIDLHGGYLVADSDDAALKLLRFDDDVELEWSAIKAVEAER